MTYDSGVVIWANDVEVSLVKHLLHHVLDGLLRCPSSVRLGSPVICACEAGVDPSRTKGSQRIPKCKGDLSLKGDRPDLHEQVGGADVRGIPQLVGDYDISMVQPGPRSQLLTLFSEDLDGAFGHIVASIPTIVSASCLGCASQRSIAEVSTGTYGGQVIPCLLPVLIITLAFSWRTI